MYQSFLVVCWIGRDDRRRASRRSLYSFSPPCRRKGAWGRQGRLGGKFKILSR
ncbi:hypothetical protein Mapa_000797 [Marchantia paleacea]|nr:hypothetical protein Mapa_000797 [Marchantia paleacea]